jgi:hypothetical protein
MAQPLGRGLRAARRSGLTSPDPVRTTHGPRDHPEPRSRARNPGQAAQEASGRTPAPASTSQNSSCRNQAGNELPELAGGSRLRMQLPRPDSRAKFVIPWDQTRALLFGR